MDTEPESNVDWTHFIIIDTVKIKRSSRTAKAELLDITAETIHRTFKCQMTLLCEFVLAREMDGAVGTPNTRVLSLDLASPGLRSLAVSGLVWM